MLLGCSLYVFLDVCQFLMHVAKVDLFFRLTDRHIARNIEVVIVFLSGDDIHRYTLRVERLFATVLIRIYNLFNISRSELILPFTFFKIIFGTCINEQYIIRLFTFFQDKDANRDTRGIEKVCGQADHGIYITIVK